MREKHLFCATSKTEVKVEVLKSDTAKRSELLSRRLASGAASFAQRANL